MLISEVITEADKKSFLKLPLKIYKDDPNWAQPLNKDINAVFDPKQNKFFRHGRCTRFLLKNNGDVIGRVAVFINEKTAKKESQPTGGMGFFECIDDQTAANLLFDKCKEWLLEKGMAAMDGPINFGERDSWWGLITSGFTPTPYKVNYNPPYYQKLFEAYGFQTWFEQWCYSMQVHTDLMDKFFERHKRIDDNPDYRSDFLKKDQLEKYAEDFRTIYNKAWARHGGGKELDKKQVQKLFKSMKPVMDGRIIWFAYYKNEPVAMWVNLPDINQLFRKFNGHFNLLDKLRFLWMVRRKVSRKMIGLVFGIVPEHQGKGLDAFIIVEGARYIQKYTSYHDYEMQWIGDFNPKMIAIAENIGASRSRILKTYRYLFDRTAEFKRHPML